MKGYGIPNLGITLMNGLHLKKSLETSSDFIKSLIYDGEIPLARTFTDWMTERKKGASQFSIWYLRDLFSAPYISQSTICHLSSKKHYSNLRMKKQLLFMFRGPSVITTEGHDSNTVDFAIEGNSVCSRPWNVELSKSVNAYEN